MTENFHNNQDEPINPWLWLLGMSNSENRDKPTALWNEIFYVNEQRKRDPEDYYMFSLSGVPEDGTLGEQRIDRFDEVIKEFRTYFLKWFNREFEYSDLDCVDISGCSVVGLKFDGAKFPKSFNAIETAFKDVSFNAASLNEADFSGSSFEGDCYFGGTIFNDLSVFKNIKCVGKVYFHSATFSRELYFQQVEVRGDGALAFIDILYVDQMFNFKNLIVHGDFGIKGAQAIIKREEVAINNPVILRFEGSVFYSRPPVLVDFKLSELTNFEGITWPTKTQSNFVTNYESLRILAEKAGMLETRKQFVVKEMACRSESMEGVNRLLFKSYGIVSRFGSSVSRPSLILAFHWLLAVIAWFGYAYQYRVDLSFWDVAGYNITKVLPLANSNDFYRPEVTDAIRQAPDVLHFLSGSLAVLGPIWIFLIALGIRFKFRLSS